MGQGGRLAAMILVGLALPGCGGGGSSSSSATPPAIQDFAVAPDPIDLGASAQLVATFSGGSGTVSPGVGAVSSGVAVSVSPASTTDYLLTVTGSAGAPLTRSLTLHVRAVSVDVAPAAATVFMGSTRSFTATIAGAVDKGVLWSVQEAGGGSIDASGLYTAPAAPGTYHVRAASHADPAQSASVAVTVPPVGVTLNPPASSLDPGAQLTLSASVGGTSNVAVTWTLAPGGSGSLIPSGAIAVFTAGGNPGTCTVTATSVADPSKQASALLTINPTGQLTLSPGALSIAPGTTQAFGARLNGAPSTAVAWSLDEGSVAGSVNAAGLYTAGSTVGTYHLRATLLSDSSRSATALVTVATAVSLQILPGSLTLSTGDAADLAYQIDPSGILRDVTWKLQEGSAAGTLTTQNGIPVFHPAAVSAPTLVHVTVTSVADPSKSSTAEFTLRPAPGAAAFQPSGSLATSRSHHAATPLLDGRILVTGGQSDARNASNTTLAELFDPTSGRATPLATPMLKPRGDHSATRLADGRVLLAGGATGWESPDRASAEVYDPATSTFAAVLNPMSVLRGSGHQALLLERGPHAGKVLVMGGSGYYYTSADATDSVDLYDPVTNRFSPAPHPMRDPRTRFALTALADGRYLLTGGSNASGNALSTAELFDPADLSFTRTSGNLAAARAWHSATRLADGKVLVAGGYDGISSAELFDPATGLFSLLPSPMKEGRFYHTATALPDGRVLFAGGRNSYWYRTLGSAEVYDPRTQDFAFLGALGRPRESHSATLLTSGPWAQKVLLMGGSDGNETDTTAVQP